MIASNAVRRLSAQTRLARSHRSFSSTIIRAEEEILLRHDVPLHDHQTTGEGGDLSDVRKAAFCSVLTLNQPKRFNPLSLEMLIRLQEELKRADAAFPRCRSVVIRAAPAGKAFCAGHDMKEIHSKLASHGQGPIRELFEICATVMESLQTIRPVTIASVHGMATAAGCQLVAAADLAVATHTARFALSGIHNGLVCSTPIVPVSRNIRHGSKHALALLLTGDFISAEQAYNYGLINQLVQGRVEDDDDNDDNDTHDALAMATMELVHKIARHSSFAIARGKDLFYKQKEMNVNDAYALATERIIDDIVHSPDACEGIEAFLKKRPPKWKT